MGTEILNIIVPFLVTYAVIVIIVAPLRVAGKWRMEAEPHFEEIDFETGHVPDAVLRYVEQSAQQLIPLGFKYVGSVVNSHPRMKAIGYVAIFVNERARDVATPATIIVEPIPGKRRTVHVMEYTTDFENDTCLSTGNMNAPGMGPQPAWKEMYRFPGMSDMQHLYRIHRELTLMRGPAVKKIFPIGRIAEEIRRDAKRECESFVQTGYARLDDSGEFYRLTMKGMFLTTWKQAWPIKPIIMSAKRRRARRILRNLDLRKDRLPVEPPR